LTSRRLCISGPQADAPRAAPQALAVLEEIVIPGTDVLDIKDEAEVAKRLRVRRCRVIATPAAMR